MRMNRIQVLILCLSCLKAMGTGRVLDRGGQRIRRLKHTALFCMNRCVSKTGKLSRD
ncbi:hypothetical protein [Fulmarus glacialis papillomavirus 1]|uniref:Uncharacterized protein n=1 Tax=Fulmarus glacialis papillomavirus 1 TaxID=1463817 RepID=A0A059TB08_9PAPI|nr:hypothetical protein [Fulmarus glacialis papillomavirus 1]AHV82121.1 hypothetical protein [Fulmarus glacialis papillomavirus 1]